MKQRVLVTGGLFRNHWVRTRVRWHCQTLGISVYDNPTLDSGNKYASLPAPLRSEAN